MVQDSTEESCQHVKDHGILDAHAQWTWRSRTVINWVGYWAWQVVAP
jgi:hypothetical protein